MKIVVKSFDHIVMRRNRKAERRSARASAAGPYAFRRGSVALCVQPFHDG